MKVLSRIFRSYRKEWFITQAELASRIGIGETTVRDIEAQRVSQVTPETQRLVMIWIFGSDAAVEKKTAPKVSI